jgi:non-ribosomal peptide synthase protein (TIGR01720 family)
LLLYPPGLDFIGAYFGCLYAGVVAVPTYPPRRKRRDPRLVGIALDSQALIALTTSDILADLKRRQAQMPELASLHWLATDSLDHKLASGWQEPAGALAIGRDTLAFIQYTSGSTGTPKGVMVSHGNLLHNSAQIQQGFEYTPNSHGVFWLPLYHDMGLIGGILQIVYGGASVTLMSPVAFLQKPLRWLEAISRYQATISGGPNFAYELCLRRISPQERATLDLSSWQIAFNGAEPVRAETLERFAATFASCGFRRTAFYPCYGMAEATLQVTAGQKNKEPIVKTVQAAALSQNQVLTLHDARTGGTARAEGQMVRTLVGCGQNIIAGQPTSEQLLIVDPDTFTPRPERQVGEIWLQGPSVAQGYWNQPEATEETFNAYLATPPQPRTFGESTAEGPFLRTGDLGFVSDGELFITGRLKDLIIIRGRNHYPQDIELTVEQSHEALQPGGGAAFSVEVGGEERLVGVQEVKRTYLRKLVVEEVLEAIRQAVSQAHELQVYGVLLIKPARIPKTSSGKIQRRACRAMFLAGEFDEVTIGRSLLADALEEAVVSPPAAHPLLTQLMQLDAESRRATLESLLQQQIAQTLHIAPSQLPLEHPLSALGIDSLMMFELKQRLEESFNARLRAYEFQQASVTWLANQILSQWTTAVAEIEATPLQAAQEVLTGALPLTPIQHYFFEKFTAEPEYWNGSVLLELTRPLDAIRVEEAMQFLLGHHDGLRLRFVPEEAGWQQFYAAPDGEVPFEYVDLSALAAEGPPSIPPNSRGEVSEQEQAIKAKMASLQRSLSLSAGPLVRAVLFDCGAEKANQVLFVIHHLIFDGTSVLTLLQDFQTAYQQLTQGQPVQLPPKSTSYRTWAQRLQAYAREVRPDYWLNPARANVAPLPVDYPSGSKREVYDQIIPLMLSPEESAAFLQHVQGHDSAFAEATFLTALATAVQEWTGEPSLLVELERHGREAIFPDVDVTRTVGFFNSRFPVLLDLPETGTPQANVQSVAAQLRQLPQRGVDYGILRYLSRDAALRSQLEALPQPQIKFIYHAQWMNQAFMILSKYFGTQGLRLLSAQMDVSPHNNRSHPLLVYAYFMGPVLQLEVRYSNQRHKPATIEKLAADFLAALRGLIRNGD